MNLRSMILMLILGSCAAQAVAQSDRWASAGQSDKFTEQLDTRTAVIAGSHVTVWVKTLWFKPETDSSGDTYNREMARKEFDCVARTSHTLDKTQWLNESFVWSGNLSKYAATAVVPDSIGEAALDAACALR